MRSLARALLTGAALALIAVAGSSSAVLAGDKYTVQDAWCFDDVVYQYCFDNEYTVKVVELKDGDGIVKISGRQHTEVFQAGQLVGVIDEVTKDRSVYVDGGLADMTVKEKESITHDGETCVYKAMLKISDYEVTLDRSSFSCD